MRWTLPLHTLLLALYFPAFLYSQNIHRFPLSVTLVPAAGILGLVILAWGLFSLILGDGRKSGILVSVNLAAFFTYGYAFSFLKSLAPGHGTSLPGAHEILLAIWIFGNVMLWFLVLSRPAPPMACTRGLNAAALALLAFPILHSVHFQIADRKAETRKGTGQVEAWARAFERKGKSGPLPDIYHIVMDAYSREDVLRHAYGFDNSAFMAFLASQGFAIGKKSYANYPNTILSLTSSLNLDYLDQLLAGDDTETRNWITPLVKLKDEAKAIRLLKRLGYRYIVIPHGWENRPPLADAVLAPGWSPQGIYLNEYQNGLLAMTPIPFAVGAFHRGLIDKNTQHRNRITFAFDALRNIHREKGPKYVYCHILAPHTPIVFGSEGEPVEVEDLNVLRKSDPEEFVKAAVGEIRFLNGKLEKIIAGLVAESQGNAVILLQSDHGEAVMEAGDDFEYHRQRHGILAALRLPGGRKDSSFHESMTPVNFYRYIFNGTFGMEMEMLEDRIYSSPNGTPFGLQEIHFEGSNDSLRKL